MARTKQTKRKSTTTIIRPSRDTLQLNARPRVLSDYAEIIELCGPPCFAEQDPFSSSPIYYKGDGSSSSKGYIFIIPTGGITRNRNKNNNKKKRHYIIRYDIENDCYSKFIKIPSDEYINKFPEICGCFLDDIHHKLYILSTINCLMINNNMEQSQDIKCRNNNIWILDIRRKKWMIKRGGFKKCSSWNIFGGKGHFIGDKFHFIYSNQYRGYHKILQFDDNNKCYINSRNNDNSTMLITRNKGLISNCYHQYNVFHGVNAIKIKKELVVIGVGDKMNEIWSLNMNKNDSKWTLCDDIKWPLALSNFYCDSSAVIAGFDGICFIFCHNKKEHNNKNKGNGGNLEIWCFDFIDKIFEKSTKQLPQKMDGWNGYPLSKYFISTNNGYCHYIKSQTHLISTHCKMDLFDILTIKLQKKLINRIISKCSKIKTKNIEFIINAINNEFNIEFESFIHKKNIFQYLPIIIKDKLLKKTKSKLDNIKYWNQVLILKYITQNEYKYNMNLSHFIKTLIMYFYGFTL